MLNSIDDDKTHPKPSFMRGDVANLPAAFDELKPRHIFVNWQPTPKKDGKIAKVPKDPKRPRSPARSNDPSTWGDYDTAVANCGSGEFGLGMMMLELTNLKAVDLDKCREPKTGEIAPEALELVKACNSYTEVTVSGTGLRVIGYGTGAKIHTDFKVRGDMHFEVYHRNERYITISGVPLEGTPDHFANIDKPVADLMARYGGRAEPEKPRKPVVDRPERDVPQELLDRIEEDPHAKGKDASKEFHATVAQLYDLGLSAAEIEDLIEWKPIVPERYEGRLAGEIQRCIDKAAQNRDRYANALQSLRDRLQGKPQAVEPVGHEWPANPLLLADGDPRASQVADELVEGTVPRVASVFISGISGSGKSFIGEDLAGATMTPGAMFAGRPVLVHGGVLWLAYEAADQVKPRLAALKAHKLKTDQHLPFVYSREPPRVQSGYADLVKLVTDAIDWLEKRFGVPLRLIVVDTLAWAAEFKDENSAAEAQRVCGMLADIARAADCCVLIVDHHGKATDAGTRGSSAKEAMADAVLTVLCDKAPTGATTNHRMAIRKLRGGAAGAIMPFHLRQVELEEGGTSAIVDWSPQPGGEVTVTRKPSLPVQKLLNALDFVLQGGDAIVLDGPMPFKAGPQDAVREAFMSRYPADTPEAKRQAFKRARTAALDARLMSSREIDGVDCFYSISREPGGFK